jgi:hypothetical protein
VRVLLAADMWLSSLVIHFAICFAVFFVTAQSPLTDTSIYRKLPNCPIVKFSFFRFGGRLCGFQKGRRKPVLER